jgi:MFS transporter, OFA family, oxalate/formate antiporter
LRLTGIVFSLHFEVKPYKSAKVVLSSFAPNLFVLYLCYGVLGGIGIGLDYIVPLAMLIKWFPDKRGLITGLAVAGFGLGAFVTGPLATTLIGNVGLRSTFAYSGIAYLIIVVAGAQFFRKAPDNYRPAGWKSTAQQKSAQLTHDFTLGEALRSSKWYVLWLTLALNVTAGAALISVVVPFAQDLTKVDAGTAAILVSVISVFNGIGQLFWGWLSDRIGRTMAFVGMFAIQIFAFLLLSQMTIFGYYLCQRRL